MYLVHIIRTAVTQSLNELFEQQFEENDFQINETLQDFEGDYTVVLFPLIKKTGLALPILGDTLGKHLLAKHPTIFSNFNLVKGFLNFTVADAWWVAFLIAAARDKNFGTIASTGKKIMVEYSSPNTNKPLHLGHLRNNFLGWSIAEILKATGNEVIKSSIVNDRGIHICKSMHAWKYFANGETPASSGKKGDHLVGEYYVKFEEKLKDETKELEAKEVAGNFSHYNDTALEKVQQLIAAKESALKEENTKSSVEKVQNIEADITELRRAATPAMRSVNEMLLSWEAGDEEVLSLWQMMNGWVYEGMNKTYDTIGCDFDTTYYESNTYLTGKDIVAEGLNKNVFYKKPDNSVWIDLTAEGLDEKLLLRKDGTSVYMTQDIGLAKQKYEDFGIDKSIYVIGDEQNYHMKVLALICKKMGLSYADDIFHLSYGMVELPQGKMKSREGTVVDADDIVAEMIADANKKTLELGKVSEFTENELVELTNKIGLGALKFFLLRIEPKKRMIFNPEESIDFQGFTASYIQFNYARICSILRKEASVSDTDLSLDKMTLLPLEKKLIVQIEQYPSAVQQAATELNPSIIANHVYQLARTFSSFYSEHSINKEEDSNKKRLRIIIVKLAAQTIKNGMGLLGIEVPEKM